MFKLSKKILTTSMAVALLASALGSSTIMSDALTGNEAAKKTSMENMMTDLNAIAVNDNARVTGFEGEHEAANYVVNEFKESGLKTRKQIIKDINGFIADKTELKLGDEVIESQILTYSNSTKDVLEAEVEYCGFGKVEDLENKDLRGKIALIKRGELTFSDKVANATAKGAAGVVIFNNSEGNLNGTLGEANLKLAPVTGITQVEGEKIVAKLEAGEKVKLSMDVKTEIDFGSHSYNVVAKLPAAKNPRTSQTIVIGAHFDSVACPGANDNASGTVSIVEAARILSQPENASKLNYNIEFVAFGAEEIGLIGSKEYVKSLQDAGRIDKVKAMINLDMVGVGNNLVLYNTEGASHEVTDIAKSVADELGYLDAETAQDLHSTSSDHAPFEAAGIPSTFLTYRMDEAGTLDSFYHQKTDQIQTLDMNYLYNTTDVVVNMVLEMQDEPQVKKAMPKMARQSFNNVVDSVESEDMPSK